ncbi:hypothetical protein LY90DRAFT_697139 [Neocallimastix californiae]|uniref:Carbohydrate-binding module family 19 domain-containing protein n=1 Tax=Neocallimastix californiae TaxID=1754190 RepID=A0A1Y2FKR4_9FUNG|nr:hypothetical protein LY90DRAFT_697139 [Neocallimastix californiae]|eukprot:ORY84560.1 hypothetical protein LY90DRAFT_697139 [Neocallimastix californiae]
MKFNLFIKTIFMFLTAVNAAVINSNEEIKKKDLKVSVIDKTISLSRVTKVDKSISNEPIPVTAMVRPECPLGKGVVMNQLIDCNKTGGKFYRKFHPYPECYSDFVCFIPDDTNMQNSSFCITIDDNVYCSADITNIDSCRFGKPNYDFKQCVKDANKIFSDFSYSTFNPIIASKKTMTIPKITASIINTKPIPISLIKTKPILTSIIKTKPIPISLIKTKPILTSIIKTKPFPISLIKTKPISISIIKTKPVPTSIIKTKPITISIIKTKPVPTSIIKTKPIPTSLIKTKPIPTNIVTNLPISKIRTSITTTASSIKSTPIPVTTTTLCPLGKGVVRSQLLECNKIHGKFYQNFHSYPECYTDFVCFIPQREAAIKPIVTDNYEIRNEPIKTIGTSNVKQNKSSCIIIENVTYCSADITNIESCKKGMSSYNFNSCVKEASKLFPDFHYIEIDNDIPIKTIPIRTIPIRTIPIRTIPIKTIPVITKKTITTSIKTISSPSPISNISKILKTTTSIDKPEPLPTIIQHICPPTGALGLFASQCDRDHGIFYYKEYGYPECTLKYACFSPMEDNNDSRDCILHDGMKYCTISSNIPECQLNTDLYNFKECIEIVNSKLNFRNYGPIISTTKYLSVTTTTSTKPTTF